MADDTRPSGPRPGATPDDARRRGEAAREREAPKSPQNDAPRLVGPEDEERRGGVPGLESDD
jgi:hypothetical protein